MPLYFGNNPLPRATYTTLPAATAVPAGTMAVATNLGANGTTVYSNGTRWLAAGGTACLATVAGISGLTNSEVISLQSLLPINAWQNGDILRVWMALTKSGSTDTLNVTVRIGTAGTTADTAITGISANTVLAAANLTGGFIFDIQLVSATSAQKIGLGSGTNSSYTGAANAAITAATTITSAAANALYVSFAAVSSSTNNTVGISSARIELLTP